MSLPTPLVASPQTDPTANIPPLPEPFQPPANAPTAGTHHPDRAEIERELLTRLQEIAVETVFAHLTDTPIDPAPLAVDLVLGMEAEAVQISQLDDARTGR